MYICIYTHTYIYMYITYYCICVLILLYMYMCPHTTLHVYMCAHTLGGCALTFVALLWIVSYHPPPLQVHMLTDADVC